MVAMTATKDDRRTQLALWVGGQGEIQFAMGNERGKGVILGAGQCQEGVWTHLAVTMEGRKVRMAPRLSAAQCDRSPEHALRTPENLRLITARVQRVERMCRCNSLTLSHYAGKTVDGRRCEMSNTPHLSATLNAVYANCHMIYH